jgi:lipopolysaccharide biosynthesis regulator YciM
MPDRPKPSTPLNARPEKKQTVSDAAIEAAAKRLTRRQIIKDASEYVKKHISRQPPTQRFFSFMPTMLTRVSPFHFKGR